LDRAGERLRGPSPSSANAGEVEVRLYGALRRFAEAQDPRGESVLPVPVRKGDTIKDTVRRIGIREEELSPNLFLNGEYSALSREVRAGDRLGLFPRDMGLLYSWYFARAGEPSRHGPD